MDVLSATGPRREDGEPETRPTRRAHSAAARQRPTAARGAGLVLVVDDTSDTRELYALYFQSRGFSVVTAEDGIERLVSMLV